jgi:ABC-2 type transport system permease protein
MSALWPIARKELTLLRVSPLAWLLFAATTALAAYLFLLHVDAYPEASKLLAGREGAPGVTDLIAAPFFAEAAGLLLLLVPLLTMRAIGEERRGSTLPLLFGAGASDAAIVLGKYLGIMAFVALLIVLIVAMPASLAWGTELDWGKLMAGALGLFVLCAAQAALGVLASAYAGHAAAAAMACYALTGLLWYLDVAARARGTREDLINYLALPTHLTALMRGVVASVDLAYFAILAAVALALAVRRVRQLRELGA